MKPIDLMFTFHDSVDTICVGFKASGSLLESYCVLETFEQIVADGWVVVRISSLRHDPPVSVDVSAAMLRLIEGHLIGPMPLPVKFVVHMIAEL